jgi:hypothetical protein
MVRRLERIVISAAALGEVGILEASQKLLQEIQKANQLRSLNLKK